jgi:hypothetical protein
MVDGSPQVVEYLVYTNLAPDRAYGSYPDGNPFSRNPLFFVTPNGTNNPALPPVSVFLNEWMASNTGSVADPADQDFDDWFELYNAGAEAVDLTDYRLTDDATNPSKYRIPAGHAIAPGGYLLVWADEEGSQNVAGGEIHVNFKLGAGGEEIRLYAPNGQLVDAVVFGTQTANVSQGRFPDGGANLVFMPQFTPRFANRGPAAVAPLITGIGVEAGGGVTLTWSAEPGRTYRVLYKDDLNAADWTSLPGDVVATGGVASRTDSSGGGQRFYQVLLIGN